MWTILRFAYTTVFILSVPVILIRLFLRSLKHPDYRKRLPERFGLVRPAADKPVIWIHAVSVGETLSAVPLAKALKAQHPSYNILFTTMTPTASEQLRKRLGDDVCHTYLPYDMPFIWSHYLKHVSVKRLILIETEIWPNLMAHAAKAHIPVTIANARLSSRSRQRYLKVPPSIRKQLLAPIDSIGAQSTEDVARFKAIGVPTSTIKETGNLKYELSIPTHVEEVGAGLKEQWGTQRLIWLAASTHEGEESIMLEAHKALLKEHPSALLVIVPRHPERFNRVHQLITKEKFTTARRSETTHPIQDVQVFLGDSMGELQPFYAACDVAVVCGSFVKVGGHNALEPAALGKPILMGPHTFNCQAVVDMLKSEKALKTVSTAEEICDALSRHLAGCDEEVQMGMRGQDALKRNKGSLKRLLAQIA